MHFHLPFVFKNVKKNKKRRPIYNESLWHKKDCSNLLLSCLSDSSAQRVLTGLFYFSGFHFPQLEKDTVHFHILKVCSCFYIRSNLLGSRQVEWDACPALGFKGKTYRKTQKHSSFLH